MVFGFEREQAPPGEFRRVSDQETPRRVVGLRTLDRTVAVSPPSDADGPKCATPRRAKARRSPSARD